MHSDHLSNGIAEINVASLQRPFFGENICPEEKAHLVVAKESTAFLNGAFAHTSSFLNKIDFFFTV